MKTRSLLDGSRPGVDGALVFDPDFDEVDASVWFDPEDRRTSPIGIPEMSELDVVRHFTGLSHSVHGVDTGPYPLGSCTMKYNPKRNDALACLDGFSCVHPHQPVETMEGVFELFLKLQRYIGELTGMDAVSLQPAAGAHGELAGLLIVRKYFEDKGESRPVFLIPDSAHGTNPASAAMAGFECRIVPTREDGLLDLDSLERLLDRDVAGLMLTNPSTFGLFEENIETIATRVHDHGALLYYDGANLNALMGISRPGDMGFDVVHVNVHKTLSTPHGGGGPGGGPVGVKAFLEPYLPVPVVREVDGRAVVDFARPRTIGRMKSHFGHVDVMVRAYCYVLTCGAAGLKAATEHAVLNANYLQERLRDLLPPVFHQRCMHECLLGGGALTVSPFSFVKRLIDFGVHPPTLVGAGCVHFSSQYETVMLVEPTESESKASLDAMIGTFRKVADEAAIAPYMIETAPHTTTVAKVIKDEIGYINFLQASTPSMDPPSGRKV